MQDLLILRITVDPSSPPTTVIATKHVQNISCDPFHPHRFLSTSDIDSVIKIWDTRRISEPVLQINSDFKTLAGIEWSQSRSGVVSAWDKCTGSIRVWDIQEVVDVPVSVDSVAVEVSQNSSEDDLSARVPVLWRTKHGT